FLSHASLSAEERRRSEQAFAEARNCVIVSTSTLELGIDVGDLDRVIQINAPATVAAFLQRLGRAGRRAGATRNCLFLALNANSLLQAAGLLLVWSKGWVEPVIAPPSPRHLSAQQILALCLQEHRVGERLWPQWWNGLDPFGTDSEVVRHLITEGYLSSDDGMLFIGPEAERRFGRRHFMEMTSVFTAPSEFTVITGRADLGRVDPALLSEEVIGPRLLLLGGRSWRVTHIDWSRRRCFVEPTDSGGKARWSGGGVAGLSYQVTRAMRDVLLGTDPSVQLTRRAQRELASVREEKASTADADRTVIRRVNNDVRWWTWAGFRANATLLATIGELAHPSRRFHDSHVSLREDLTYEMWRSGMNDIAEHLRLPHIDERALDGLKFSAALPRHIAIDTLASRLADRDAALRVLAEPISHMTS
ncbi:MAG: helicase-related protein, partial [Micromonosporaceae bacterium]